MTDGAMQFWWAARAFMAALAGALVIAGGLMLLNVENSFGGVVMLSTIGALIGSVAGWRLFGGKVGGIRDDVPV
mgnify:CR=1 FL=1